MLKVIKRGSLVKLAEHWEQSARTGFTTAKRYEDGSIEQRFCEHGAACYFNCAAALRELIGEQLPNADK